MPRPAPFCPSRGPCLCPVCPPCPQTKELKFELRGDGALPQIVIELPPQPVPPRTAAEASAALAKGKAAASTRDLKSQSDKRPVSKDGKAAKGAPAAPPPTKQLTFPRTIVGEQAVSWVKVCNASELPASIRFNFATSSVFSFPSRNEEILLQPHRSAPPHPPQVGRVSVGRKPRT